jgi:Protein of unknown function (DUF4038)/Domain of unknown function (DUF5060)/Putative collagen-binding domain of a collagenase
MLAMLLRYGVLIAALSMLAGCTVLPRGDAMTVRRYDVFEAVLTSTANYTNPYMDVSVDVTFVAPDGSEHTVPAFHDGDATWRARIAPEIPGKWRWRTTSSVAADGGLNDVIGSFDCVDSHGKGFIRPDPAAKYWFSLSDGTPFYGIGDTAYGLVNGISDRQLAEYLDRRRSQRFNHIRFFASGFPLQVHPELAVEESWPWGGTPQQPDYDRLNPRYFHRLEWVVQELDRRDLYAELLIFNYYVAPFTDPSVWTPEREALWLGNVIARLAASRRVFLWTVTNEYENYPDGRYRYDAGDDDWARRIAAAVRTLDPQHHPTSVHNFTFDSRGGVSERFGSDAAIDVLAQQKWGEATTNGRALEGSAEGIERSIWADRIHGKPVINSENGYEWLDSRPAPEQETTTDKARRAAWRVFVAGGASYAAGFAGTWAGTHETGGDKRPFVVRDMGWGSQVTHLSSFVAATNFMQMSPAQDRINAPNLALAAKQGEVVVYAPQGGAVTVDLSTEPGRTFSARWFDPRNGRYRQTPAVRGGGVVSFAADAPHDWVLHLRPVDR